MPVQIDENYRIKVSRIVRRNLEREVPISGIFKILANWRVATPNNHRLAVESFSKQAKPFDGDVRAYREILENMPTSPFIH